MALRAKRLEAKNKIDIRREKPYVSGSEQQVKTCRCRRCNAYILYALSGSLIHIACPGCGHNNDFDLRRS